MQKREPFDPEPAEACGRAGDVRRSDGDRAKKGVLRGADCYAGFRVPLPVHHAGKHCRLNMNISVRRGIVASTLYCNEKAARQLIILMKVGSARQLEVTISYTSDRFRFGTRTS